MKDWLAHTNIYEVNVRQYTTEGTLQAFTKHLPRLKEMGVETLWFMPLTPIAKKNSKGSMGSYYACSDFTGISTDYGKLEDFKTLVQTAHSMSFKVIIDWVANHTGWDHWWTVQHPDWYKKDEHTGDFKKASGMDDIIELDFSHPALRRSMINAMKFWIEETGIDGFRCDLAFWVPIDFWKEARAELHKLKELLWLGELDSLDNADYMEVFDAAYTWRWMRATEQFYKGNLSFTGLVEVLHAYTAGPGHKAWFTTNHDENSWNGTEYEKYGNMAQALAVFSCTWPGIPLIYSGQELPNRKRLAFFEKDVIEWKEEIALHDFYRVLLHLKKNQPALSFSAGVELMPAADGVLFFKRTAGNRRVWIILNLTRLQQQASFVRNAKELTDVFTGQRVVDTSIQLAAWEYKVLAD